MLKLRITLLSNYLYYVILAIALLYFLIVSNFVTYKSKYNDNEIKITGRITNITLKDYGFKLEIKGKEKVIGYIYAKDNDYELFLKNYSIGDKVLLDVNEQRITNNTVVNTFNYKKYLYNKGIFRVYEVENIEKVEDNKNIFYGIKNYLYRRSYKLEKSYPYINTLLFGNKSDLEDSVYDSYRENGVSHLFAISGTHIQLFVLLLGFLLKKLKISENKRYVILILFLMFFMFLTNFSMSVVRTSLFTILMFINKIYYFYIKPENLLYLTLSIIIFNNPLNLFDVGLLYSFSISLSLILMSKEIESKKSFLTKSLMVSLISFIVSFPITIYNFYQVNFLSIIYNLFFVPYVSYIILPLVVISYIIPIFDKILFFFIQIMESLSLFLEDINIFKIIMCKPNMSIIIVYYVSIYLFLKGIKKKKISLFIPFALIILFNYIGDFSKNNEITFIDVGQGDSVYLSVNDTSNIIDTGGVVMTNDSKYTYNIAKNKIIPYLKSKGIRKIENLFLTHGDADHIRESIYLIEHFKVKNVYFNSNSFNYLEKKVIKTCKERGVKYRKLNKGDVVNLNGIKIYLLNGNNDDENSSSLVLFTVINNKKILLTGDIPKVIEKQILDDYKIKNIDILKLAHHGSNTSSDISFLERLNPRYSIISVGIDNKYGHPSKETIDNLNNLKLKYYETSKYGSIEIDLNNYKIRTCSP